MKNMN